MSDMVEFLKWIHDDITWCIDSSCPIADCFRNQLNMANHSGLHSYADFRNCDECMIYRLEHQEDNEGSESP